MLLVFIFVFFFPLAFFSSSSQSERHDGKLVHLGKSTYHTSVIISLTFSFLFVGWLVFNLFSVMYFDFMNEIEKYC